MSGLDDMYARNLHKHLGYYATWQPTDHITLGDFGTMKGNIFWRAGNIKDFGIKVKPRASHSENLDYQSESGVNVNVDVSATTKGVKAEGNVKFNFSQSNAIAFKADDITTEQMENIHHVGERLVDLYKEKGNAFRLEHVVVTELKKAGALLVLISRESSGGITLSGKIPVKVGGVTVADINIRDVTVTKSDGRVEAYLDKDGSTPLFRLSQVKDPITKKAFFAPFS